MSKPKGFSDTLSPDVAAEMERLWCKTAIHQDEIARSMNERFATAFAGRNIEWHARRRGWGRDMISRSFNSRSLVQERLAVQSLLRSRRIEDNPVRLVAPGTYAAKGFRLGRR